LPSISRTASEQQDYLQTLLQKLNSTRREHNTRLDLNSSPPPSPPSSLEASRPSSPIPAYSLDLNEKKEKEEISDLFFNGLRQRHRELCGSKCNV
jgi:hypothetical protein